MEKKKLSSKFHTIFWACFSLFMFVLDFASKWIVNSLCEVGKSYPIIKNFLYVRLSYNTGIAFSIGAGNLGSRFINIFISLAVSIAIAVYYFINRDKQTPFMKAILSLLFAGAIGNFVDRAFYWESTVGFNGVIDFIQFYLGGGPTKATSGVNPFATFNIADSCLTIGIILFIISMLPDLVKGDGKEDLSKDPRIKESTKEENPTRENGVKEKEIDEKIANNADSAEENN